MDAAVVGVEAHGVAAVGGDGRGGVDGAGVAEGERGGATELLPLGDEGYGQREVVVDDVAAQ